MRLAQPPIVMGQATKVHDQKAKEIPINLVKNCLTRGPKNLFDNGSWICSLGREIARWHPGSWNLKERKIRERLQLEIKNILILYGKKIYSR